MKYKSIVFFDLETSGLDPKKDRIIEIGFLEIYVRMSKNNWEDSYSSVECKRVDLITTLEQAIAKDDFYKSVFETKEIAQQYCDHINKETWG